MSEESSLKRLGIAAGKTVREYLGCFAEFMEGLHEGMGDVTDLVERVAKTSPDHTPPVAGACTCDPHRNIAEFGHHKGCPADTSSKG